MPQSQIRTRTRISLASHAGERGAPAGWIGAIFLHALIVAAVVFTFTHSFPLDITDESAPVVPVDLVTIAPKTNIIAQAKPEPKPAPNITPEPLQPDQLKLQQPPVPQEETAPPPQPAPSEQAVKPPPLPTHRPQEQKPADTKKTESDSINQLLNKVLSSSSAPKNAQAGPHNTMAFGSQTAMTADLQDALRSQIKACWSPPVGAPSPEQMIVDFDLFLSPNGMVAQPPQLVGQSASEAVTNPYTRAAKEAAERAIYECQPYKLPTDKYSLWREINPFHFDPRQMMGE
jgi:outer membrane biosynthesis protein TonB